MRHRSSPVGALPADVPVGTSTDVPASSPVTITTDPREKPSSRLAATATTRRVVLAGVAAVGVGATVAACTGQPSSSGGGSGTLPVSVPSGDVPVGGGTVLPDQQVVVTQPAQGVFKAFSAVCTHQGCLVSTVANDQIVCQCHNSVFSATNGSVLAGPARRALTEVAVTAKGGTLTVG